MKLDRTTYEIFLIDYLEGNLTPLQVSELLLFLEQNPDLKQEFEGVEFVLLHHDQINPLDKSALKKSEQVIVTPEIEQLLFAKTEGDATAEELTQLEELTHVYPSLKKEEKLFSLARLSPNEQFVFTPKRQLKKYSIGVYYKYVSAIAAMLLATFFIYSLYQPNKHAQQLSQITPFENNLNNHSPNKNERVVKSFDATRTTTLPISNIQTKTTKLGDEEVVVNRLMLAQQAIPVQPATLVMNKPTLQPIAMASIEFTREPSLKIVLAGNNKTWVDENGFLHPEKWIKRKVKEETNPNQLLQRFNNLTGAGIVVEKDTTSGKVTRFEIAGMAFAMGR